MEWRNGWQSVKPKANCRRKLFSFHGSYNEQENRARYEVRPRKDKRGADLISDVLPLGRNLVIRSQTKQRNLPSPDRTREGGRREYRTPISFSTLK